MNNEEKFAHEIISFALKMLKDKEVSFSSKLSAHHIIWTALNNNVAIEVDLSDYYAFDIEKNSY